ncbi:MAG: hypothetical protein LBK75_09140 [Oscillospiraceae bacterium]|jgi:hypothetical protein|nr:hypothetical protein [Oscillospiraceae bacterium]
MKKRRICLLALWLCVSAAVPARAAADGTYLAATHTHYLNPDTGRTDDGGTQNAALGEGMCRSVVYEKALAEIRDGRCFVTVRLQLMSNMRDFRLSAQQTPGGAYAAITPAVMQEDAAQDTADYRFEIPALDSYLCWEMYVVPMGRDVKFYMNLDTALTEGTGDFVAPRRTDAGTDTSDAGVETSSAANSAGDTPNTPDGVDTAAAGGTGAGTPVPDASASPADTSAPNTAGPADPPGDAGVSGDIGVSGNAGDTGNTGNTENTENTEAAGETALAFGGGTDPAGGTGTDLGANPGAAAPDETVPAAAPADSGAKDTVTGTGFLAIFIALVVFAAVTATSLLLRKARRTR